MRRCLNSQKVRKKHSLFVFLFGDTIIPGYIPFYYRLYLLWCKSYRSIKRRLFSLSSNQEAADNEAIAEPDKVLYLGESREPVINKSFSNIDSDLKSREIDEVTQEISRLRSMLDEESFRVTTPAGNFKVKDSTPENERRKLWENAWILANSKVDAKDVVLDIGGASSIFSFYLAEMGCMVYEIDNDWGNQGIVYNSNFISKENKWKMKLYKRDVSKKLPFNDSSFDKIFCICVLEHLSPQVRRKLMEEIGRVLKPAGIAGLTFDYDINRNTPGLDKGIRYSLKNRIMNDIIEPSGLKIYGNMQFIDDCPEQFFLGSLFLTKPA